MCEPANLHLDKEPSWVVARFPVRLLPSDPETTDHDHGLAKTGAHHRARRGANPS